MPRSLRISSHGPTAKDCDYTKGRYYLSTLLLGKEDSFFAGKLIDMLAQILAANLCSTLGTLGALCAALVCHSDSADSFLLHYRHSWHGFGNPPDV